MPKTSPLIAALLSDEPVVRARPKPKPEPVRKDVTIYTGAATAMDAQPLRTSAPAAAVAILENPLKQRAVVEQFDEASSFEVAIAAAALGLETLTSPCRVRLFTECVYLVYAMTGRVRAAGYYEQMSRLERAIRRGRHQVEWVEDTTGYDQALLAIARGSAIRLSHIEADAADLAQLTLETTALAARARETGCAPPTVQRFSLSDTVRQMLGSITRRFREAFTT